MDVIADLARPLPAIVSAEMLGLPPEDWPQLTAWSRVFAEILGNFQPDPDSVTRVLRCVEEMTAYLRHAIRDQAEHPATGCSARWCTPRSTVTGSARKR